MTPRDPSGTSPDSVPVSSVSSAPPVLRNPSSSVAEASGLAQSATVAVHSSVGAPLIATASEPHMPWPQE